MADTRIKLDTVNSDKLSKIADLTQQNPQDIIRTYLDEKIQYLQLSEVTVSDSTFLDKVYKYQSAMRELVTSYIREKQIDADSIKAELEKDLSQKQEANDTLTATIKTKDEEIASAKAEINKLSEELISVRQELELLKTENKSLKNNSDKLDNILKLINSKKSQDKESTNESSTIRKNQSEEE